MSALYVPDDSEARLLLRSAEKEQDLGRKAEMVDMLGRYRTAKVVAGLEPFAPDLKEQLPHGKGRCRA